MRCPAAQRVQAERYSGLCDGDRIRHSVPASKPHIYNARDNGAAFDAHGGNRSWSTIDLEAPGRMRAFAIDGGQQVPGSGDVSHSCESFQSPWLGRKISLSQ